MMFEYEIAGEQALLRLLATWADGIARHDPSAVAALFTDDALFQGFDPAPGFGRAVVEAYYAKQPAGLVADWELLTTRRPADDVVIGYARVLFRRPDGNAPTYLTVVATRVDERWLISHYHVSRAAAQPHEQ